MTKKNAENFGKWRSIFWPIYSHEVKRFIPMGMMMFFILFNFSILRNLKETLIITAIGSGAHVFSFLKIGAVVPCAFFFFFLYIQMSNLLSKRALFYATITPFIAFFIFFALFLYPNHHHLHPHAFADYLESLLPPESGLSGAIALLRNWTFTLFYVAAELWGSIVLSLLFWGFANDITSIDQSKRFYALFPLISNFALLISGSTELYYLKNNSSTNWSYTLNSLMFWMVLSALAILAIYYWMQQYVLEADAPFAAKTEPEPLKKKKKLSLRESLSHILRSKYLAYIALLVVGFNVSIHLCEVLWKHQVKKAYMTSKDYETFMATYTIIIGMVNFPVTIIGTNVIRRLGWKVGALATPFILTITSVFFFFCVIFKDIFQGSFLFSATALAIFFGALQNILSKATKYTLFDATKEMAFIPLGEDAKVKGKAAVDVIVARFGKLGGASIIIFLLSIGTLDVIAPYVAIIMLLVVGIWVLAVHALDKKFTLLTKKSNESQGALQDMQKVS